MNDNSSFNMSNKDKISNDDVVPKYQATANYNTMLNSGVNIDNVDNKRNNNISYEVNVNHVLEDKNINKSDIVMPSYNLNQQNIQNITMPEFAVNDSFKQDNQNVELHDTTNSINDKVIVKKTKKTQFKISKDMLGIFVIALILLIVIFVTPVIFDFIDNLKNKIAG